MLLGHSAAARQYCSSGVCPGRTKMVKDQGVCPSAFYPKKPGDCKSKAHVEVGDYRCRHFTGVYVRQRLLGEVFN